MAQASGTRTGQKQAPPRRRGSRRGSRPGNQPSKRRWRELAGLAAGILAGVGVTAGWLISTRAHPAAPEVFSSHAPVLVRGPAGGAAAAGAAGGAAASAEPDPVALDAQWADYSDHSSCADWAGGDGVSAVRLNSSQLAWFFSDTYLGPAGPTTGFSHLSGFMHNSVVVQTSTGAGSTFVTLTGGGACAGPGRPGDAAPVVGSAPTSAGVSADRYWEEDGLVTGGTVVKFYNHYLGGTVPFVPDGTVIATFDAAQLGAEGRGHQYGAVARPNLVSLPSYTPPDGGSPILWGAALLRAGNTVYVYGTQSPDGSVQQRRIYLARVPVSQLTAFSAWKFYAGGGTWTAAQSGAQPVQPPGGGIAVSSGFSVIAAGHRYWLVQAASAVGGRDIDAYPASAPWGPFDAAAARVLYRDPAIGLDAAHDYRIMYEARAEPALSTPSTLVISYNVNSEAVTTGCEPMSAFTNTLTLPRFVAVPMAALAAVPGARAAQARSGPSDYPRIVQRNPSQWFDAWDYQSGCPPVPALISVQARPSHGQVRLSWPDAGLKVRYLVYLQGPGEPGGSPVMTAYHDGATVTGLRPGQYTATVVPVNFRKLTGPSAEVTFTVP